MAWTLCTSGAAIASAGANANSTIIASGATLALWSDAAESMACNEARVDVVTAFGTMTSAGKQILQDITASHIAQKIIGYEPEAIGTGGATLRLNILENNIRRGLKQIKEGKIKDYLGAT